MTNLNFNLGALTSLTASTNALLIDGARDQGVKLLKLKAAISLRNKTAGEGPITVGIAIGVSAAEIAEAIVADPQGISDDPALQRSQRRVFPIWYFGKEVANTADLSEGPVKKLEDVDIPWKMIEEGLNMFWYAFNHDSSDLTTGTSIDIVSVAVQEWLRD